MELSSQIEAILFYKPEPISARALADMLKVKEGDIWEALEILENDLNERGIILIRKDDKVILGTSPQMGEAIERISKEELEKDIGKAALETLTIILYQGPISKVEIDYIRGVNSSFILRNLLVRGLIERELNTEDKRSFSYSPSLDLFAFLGITKQEELPEYKESVEEIKKFKEETDLETNSA
jgi:segregation and condensation protein B